jgi:hypothetical protein
VLQKISGNNGAPDKNDQHISSFIKTERHKLRRNGLVTALVAGSFVVIAVMPMAYMIGYTPEEDETVKSIQPSNTEANKVQASDNKDFTLPAEERFHLSALVIGNAEYVYFNKLTNPINDAKAVSKTLTLRSHGERRGGGVVFGRRGPARNRAYGVTKGS